VRPGWKSVTLPFDEAISAASLILPGSRVDILTIPHAAPGELRRAAVVMQDVRVLAVGEVRHRDGHPIRASTLSVEVATDADAYRLMRAAASGSLRYLLRGSDDSNVGRVALPTRRVVVELNSAPCSNRRGNSLVYDAVLLSCGHQSQVFLVDSVAPPDRPR
jgi:Flp pilus assembly protein CpaB